MLRRTSLSATLRANGRRQFTKSGAATPLSEGEQAIFDKLQAHFNPSKLQVQDISGGCGTFYAIGITSKSFQGLPLVKQHRLVNSLLKDEISGIHGLQIKTAAD